MIDIKIQRSISERSSSWATKGTPPAKICFLSGIAQITFQIVYNSFEYSGAWHQIKDRKLEVVIEFPLLLFQSKPFLDADPER